MVVGSHGGHGNFRGGPPILRSVRYRNRLRASVGFAIALSLVAGASGTPAAAGRPAPPKVSKPAAPSASPSKAPKASKLKPKPKAPSPKPKPKAPPAAAQDNQPGPVLDGVRRVSVARSEFVDDFLNTDGTHTALMGLQPRNITDARGGFVPIVKAVRPNRDGDLVTGAHALSPKFAKRASADKTVSFAPGGNPVSFGLIGSRAVPVTKLGSTGVRYAGVLDGVDLDYRVFNDGVKEELVIRKRPAPAAPAQGVAAKAAAVQLSWQSVYDAPGLKASKARDGSILFKNMRGVAVASVPAGEAWDSAAKRSVVPVSYTLGKRGGSTLLTVSVDRSWATSAKRTYPLHVDPTFTYVNTSGISYYRRNNATAVSDTGVGCLSCGIRVGNDRDGDNKTWRTAAKFPYEQLYGTFIQSVSIAVELEDTRSANLTTQLPLDVHAAKEFDSSYQGYESAVLASQTALRRSTTLTSWPLKEKIKEWVDARDTGRRLFFIGTETSTAHTYNELSATMTVTYARLDLLPVLEAPMMDAFVPPASVSLRIWYPYPTLKARWRYTVYDDDETFWTSAWTTDLRVDVPKILPSQGAILWRVDVQDGFTVADGHDTASPIRTGHEWSFQTINRPLPIIFIPGIGGSTLETAPGWDGAKEMWPQLQRTATSTNDEHFDDLRLEEDGISESRTNIQVGHVIKKLGTEDFYQTTYDHLQEKGYRENDLLVPFPYDWRKSQAHNAAKLSQLIDEVLVAKRVAKVNILAHSMGGMVAETAIETNAATAAKVNRIVTLGTPHLGAARILGMLEYNEPCHVIRGIIKDHLERCWLDNDEVAKLFRNWPGALELLPGRNYMAAVGSPITQNYDADGDKRYDGPMTFEEYRAELADRNLALIDDSFRWHDARDGWAPASTQVGLLRIVGDKKLTISRWAHRLVPKCQPAPRMGKPVCKQVVAVDYERANGDGMVEVHSAALVNSERGFDQKGNGINIFLTGVNHDGIAQASLSTDMAVKYLEGSGRNPTCASGFNAYSQSVRTASAADQEPLVDELLPLPEGTSLTPTPASGTELDITGAVSGSVTDALGNITGVTDAALRISDADIPDSQYDAGPEHASTVLQQDGSYDGTWTVTADGDVRFLFRTYTEDVVTRVVAFPQVEVVSGAVITMSFQLPGSDSPKLRIDDNADGNGGQNHRRVRASHRRRPLRCHAASSGWFRYPLRHLRRAAHGPSRDVRDR